MELGDKIYDFEERLVRLAGRVIFFCKKLENNFESDYYKKQLIRSSGSAALNYGEAQGTITNKDFIHKLALLCKELKESRSSLKILKYIKAGDALKRDWLLEELDEVIAISSKMIINKQK